MNVKKESIHAKESSGSVVDLNNAKVQKRMLDYIQYGVPASDKKFGHNVLLQAKVTPIQADILEGIREKGPKGYWKSQSQLLRSAISLGCYVIIKFLEKSDDIPQLKNELQLQELINRANKQVRVSELLSESGKIPLSVGRSVNIDEELDRIQKLLRESD